MSDIITYPEDGITYDADDAAGYLATRSSGVYSAEEDFAVTPGGKTDVQISAGHAWVHPSRWIGRSIVMKQAATLTLPDADVNLPRIDRVVLRYDALARKTTLTVLTGTPASSPTAPEITRDTQIYDLCLAEITRPAGSAAITTANISDTRMDATLCGLMQDGVKSLPLELLLSQANAQVQTMLAALQQSIDGVKSGSFYTKGEADKLFTPTASGINMALGYDLTEKLKRLERMMNMDGKLVYTGAGTAGKVAMSLTVPETVDYIVVRMMAPTAESGTNSVAAAAEYGSTRIVRGGAAVAMVGGTIYEFSNGVKCSGDAPVRMSFAADGTLNVSAVRTESALDYKYPFNVEGYQYL